MFFIIFISVLISTALAAPSTLRPATHPERYAQTLPFFLNIRNPNRLTFAPEYLISNGSSVPTTDSATSFQLTGYGGLSTVSTETSFVTVYLGQGLDDPIQPWFMSPSLQDIYTRLSLETTADGKLLRWTDRRFQNGAAQFCQLGRLVHVIFWGSPEACEVIDLVATRMR